MNMNRTPTGAQEVCQDFAPMVGERLVGFEGAVGVAFYPDIERPAY